MPRITVANIRPFIRAPHQLILRDELLAVGFSAHSWRTACERLVIREVHPGVAIEPGRELDPTSRIAAAVEGVGTGSLASHRSAAFLWGISINGTDPIDIIRTERGARSCLDGVKVHRPVDGDDLEPVEIHGIPTTSAIRTLLDLGAERRIAVDDTLVTFIARGLVTVDSVDDALRRHSERGRTGLVALRTALHRVVLTEKPVDSVLEERMARLARRYRLPKLRFHAVVEGYVVDFLIVGTPFYIECEGWTYHGLDKEQFEFDRRREAVLSAAGYIAIRLTWKQIVHEPAFVARHVVGIVRNWENSTRSRSSR